MGRLGVGRIQVFLMHKTYRREGYLNNEDKTDFAAWKRVKKKSSPIVEITGYFELR